MFLFDSLYYRLFRLLPSKKLRARYEQKYQRLKRFKKLPEILEKEINELRAENERVMEKLFQEINLLQNGGLCHIPYDVFMASNAAANNAFSIPRENFERVFLSVASAGNSVTIGNNPRAGRVYIEIKGKNNTVCLGDLTNVTGPLHIYIRGNNSVTDIGDIYLGTEGMNVYNGITVDGIASENTSVVIGDDCCFESCIICSYHSGTRVCVGEKCMFGHDIALMGSDTHPIYDYETKEILNKAPRGITVGKHCWIGNGAKILKTVSVPDDSIIGLGAIVTKSFDEPHCAIAGNPANIVKRGVTWDFQDKDLFV